MTKSHHILFIIACLLAACTGTQPVRGTQTGTTTTLVLDGDTVGCGFFFVHKNTRDKTKSVMVHGETDELKLSKTPKTFDIENTPGLEVRFYVHAEADHSEGPCSASSHVRILQEIKATSGKVTIFITREKIKESPHPRAYAITVILEKVTFPNSNGDSYYIEKAEMKDVVVGTQSA